MNAHGALLDRPTMARRGDILGVMGWLLLGLVQFLAHLVDPTAAFALAAWVTVPLSVVQLAFVLVRAFRLNWAILFAYVFHWIFIGFAGAAALVTTTDSWIAWGIATGAVAAQMVLGHMALSSQPLRVRIEGHPVALTIAVLICAPAALAKFVLYFQQVLDFGAYVAIYTEGAEVRDSSPLALRLLASGLAPLTVLAFADRRTPAITKGVAIVAVLGEMLIGTRGRPLFVLAACIAVSQERLAAWQPARKIVVSALAGAALAAALVVGYLRDGYEMAFDAYLSLTLGGLASTFEAIPFALELSVPPALVFTQFVALLFPTDLSSLDTVARAVSAQLNPYAYALGFGVSSSALLELALIVPSISVLLVYPLFAAGITATIVRCMESRARLLFMLGVAALPSLFYLWRAELWQLLIPLIKAAPLLALLLFTLKIKPASTAPA